MLLKATALTKFSQVTISKITENQKIQPAALLTQGAEINSR